jgi:hypothetical protein
VFSYRAKIPTERGKEMTRLEKEEENRKWQQKAANYYALKYYRQLDKLKESEKETTENN